MLSDIDNLIGGLVILRNATKTAPQRKPIWVGTIDDGKLAVHNASLEVPARERACLRDLGWACDDNDGTWVFML